MKNPFLWIAIVIILAVGGWYVYSTQMEASAPEAPAAENGDVAGDEFIDDSKDGGAAVSAYTIRYTDDGFSPSSMTVPVGTTVTFVNQGTGEMWVGSDEHPSHTGYSGTSKDEHCPNTDNAAFDQCGVGSTYSFTFTKAGTWGYHNHRESDHHGTIIVTE